MFSTICDLEHDRIAITTTSTRMFTPKPNTCTCVQNMVNIEARWSPGWDTWDTEFSRFPLQGMHEICCQDSVFLIRPTPNTWQYFASYFEYINFLVCRPYIWSIKCVKEHSNLILLCLTVVMASSEPVGLARPHCYAVSWDVYPSNQDKYSSWVNPLGLGDTVYPEKEWALCLRWVSKALHLKLFLHGRYQMKRCALFITIKHGVLK